MKRLLDTASELLSSDEGLLLRVRFPIKRILATDGQATTMRRSRHIVRCIEKDDELLKVDDEDEDEEGVLAEWDGVVDEEDRTPFEVLRGDFVGTGLKTE